MSRRKKTRIKRMQTNEVELVASMQKDLCYLKQFVVNVTAMLRDRDGKEPAILVTSQASDETAMLTRCCWDELMKFIRKYKHTINPDELPGPLRDTYLTLQNEIEKFKHS